jgi:hypothetical protein
MKDYYKERKKLCHQGWLYAIQRIDLLIISISGAGLYLVFETIKYIIDKDLCKCCTPLLKYAGICFVAGIVVNIISQFTGMRANVYESEKCDIYINGEDPPTTEELRLIGIADHKGTIWTKWTGTLNITSMVFMSMGIILLIIFFNNFI